MLLYIEPSLVDMKKAAKNCDSTGTGRLMRRKGEPGTYWPTGIRGDPTLATREKGRRVVEAMVADVTARLRPCGPPRFPSRPGPPAQPK